MNGILLINKEKDYTSRDVVNIISSIFKTKKVGHTGTLDPLATGILVVTVGEATKISELLTSTYKEYIAEVKLGILTDTLDITGNILKEEKVNVSEEQIRQALKNKIGTYNQEVPIYSAVKVEGKKLYEYARNNEDVILPKKEVEIKELELLSYNEDTFTMRCLVSKGTYIRSLIRDIAYDLNTVGIMTELNRTKQGKFDLKKAYKLDDVKNGTYNFLSIEEALDIYMVEVDDYIANRIKNGCLLQNRYDKDIVMFKKDRVLAIYKVYEKDKSKLKPWKMFNM